MASLNPNTDAVTAMIAKMGAEMAPIMARSDLDGVQARMSFAIAGAAVLALAKEEDRGTPADDQFLGICAAMTNVIAQSAGTIYGAANEAAGCVGILKVIQHNLAGRRAGLGVLEGAGTAPITVAGRG